MNATVNIICYKQKTLKNGEHPLMIRVTKNGKRKYKSLGISVHPDHWDFKTNRPKLKCPSRKLILKTILEKETEFQREILELNSRQKENTASSLITAKTNQIKAKTIEEFYNELSVYRKCSVVLLNRCVGEQKLRLFGNFRPVKMETVCENICNTIFPDTFAKMNKVARIKLKLML